MSVLRRCSGKAGRGKARCGRRPRVGLALGAMVLLAGCQALVAADATPVPGAAATLTRSSRTAIPTPVRTPSPVAPVAIASPSRPPVASPTGSSSVASAAEDQVQQIQGALAEILASDGLPKIEQLLLDHVSLSTAEGGQVLDRDAAAGWLREHAGPGLHIAQVDRSSLSALLEIRTEGWPANAPLTAGRITFNLHKYAAGGTEDDEHGDWRIDVIGAE